MLEGTTLHKASEPEAWDNGDLDWGDSSSADEYPNENLTSISSSFSAIALPSSEAETIIETFGGESVLLADEEEDSSPWDLDEGPEDNLDNLTSPRSTRAGSISASVWGEERQSSQASSTASMDVLPDSLRLTHIISQPLLAPKPSLPVLPRPYSPSLSQHDHEMHKEPDDDHQKFKTFFKRIPIQHKAHVTWLTSNLNNPSSPKNPNSPVAGEARLMSLKELHTFPRDVKDAGRLERFLSQCLSHALLQERDSLARRHTPRSAVATSFN